MRIGIIGTGSMGKNHLRVVDSIPELKITCAVDNNDENLNSACEPYKLEKFGDYRKIVNMVDSVMISTPTKSHYSIAKYFLENKKPVLVEKPFTSTIEQANELIKISEENKLPIYVDHLERFNPAIEYIEKIVKRPLFIEVQRLGSFSPRSLDIDVIMDLMIHDLDIILQWDKSKIKQIDSLGVPIISNKIDIANARLEFNSGLVVNITASRVSQKKTRKLRIFQKDEYISLDYKKKRVKTYSISNGKFIENIPEIDSTEPLYNFWSNFYKNIKFRKKFSVTSYDARDAIELAIMISKSIKNNFEI